MATQRRPLMAGNWKMNLDHLQAIALVQKVAWTLKDAKHDYEDVEVAVFPPFTDIRSVQTIVEADKLGIRFGGQDLSPHDDGAHTGDISGVFLKALSCSYVIIGHSERRQNHGEDDELIAQKVAAAVRNDLIPVICVGETAEDLEEHGASAIPVEQVKKALAEIPASAEIVIAYEPVWAIGSGKAASAEQAQEVCHAIREAVGEVHSTEQADRTRILYGGSVKSENIAGFMREPDIDGALIGGASLKPDDFAAIARYQHHVGV